ncbi:hypothetical protein [Ruoffia tabacinasalis]|nr:hypothetical protein [Ruoffia tabacinasalis]
MRRLSLIMILSCLLSNSAIKNYDYYSVNEPFGFDPGIAYDVDD